MQKISRRSERPRSTREAGAVAVEFALILPIFLVLVLGIAEMGRAFNIQVSLTQAAREAARHAAIHNAESSYTTASAQAVGVAAAPSVALTAANVGVSYSSGATCTTTGNAVVTVNYSTAWMTGFPNLIPGMPATLSMQGKGVMRCGG
ncbi:pilus assembly protein [Arthrobacter sp. RT-1]|uniref:TadE/TadG family type IV pilus assembly protein n=1 Tax=Arthrobacter sp. RT-1 TaxID=2292263 RepID=UPI000E1E59CB|nr:TadE/TadG family type IV pilus assembly protein [Arthrobacter sp. RT-1]RDV09884.1 pilus assembly protein [Arthrobacter sp. RT-1]